MNRIPFLFKLFLIISLGITTLPAKALKSGRLYPGQSVKVIPQEGYVFGITKSSKSRSKNANYTLRMKNFSDLIYEDKNQSDDVYLSFTDGVEQGDAIYVRVHKGIFDYGLKKFEAIPQIVQDVLEEEPVDTSSEFGNDIVETVQFTEELPPSYQPSQISSSIGQTVANTNSFQSNSTTEQLPVSDSKGFFSIISNAFNAFFKSFKSSNKSTQSVSSMGGGIENLDAIETSSIESQSASHPSVIKENIKPAQLPTFDDTNLQQESKIKNITFNENITAPKLNIPQEPTNIPVRSVPKMQEHITAIPASVTTPEVIKTVTPPKMQEIVQPKVKEIPLPKVKVNKPDCVVPSVENSIPMAKTYPSDFRQAPQPKTIAPTVVDTSYKDQTFDTGYKEEYKDLNPTPTPPPVFEVQEPIKEEPIVIKKIQKPKPVLKPEIIEEESTNSKKIVITKIIDPENQPVNEEPMERMSDRVLGGSYAGSSGGKLGVKVYKNSKPVAAWIEVYKSNSKQRVKTFYTSRGSNIKTVKLPAGQYDIKATYRAKSVKQKKYLNNVNIDDGEKVNKSLSFNDGTLQVIAKRGDDPLYVKVTVFKNSNGKKVTYDFSSRRTGIATLSLPVGTYEIEVKEHLDVRTFVVKIRSGKKKVINANF
jgi:hypothetical protein